MTDTPITAEAVAEMRAMLDKATPGPWEIDRDYRPGMSWNNHIVGADPNLRICFMAHDGDGKNATGEANVRLIIALQNNAPALLALAERSLAPSSNAEVAREIVRNTTQQCCYCNTAYVRNNDDLAPAITAALDAKDRAGDARACILNTVEYEKFNRELAELEAAKDREPAKAPVLTVPPLTDDQKEYLNDIQAAAAEAERDDWRKLYYETIGFVAELERRCAELEGERDYWRSQVDADRKMVATVAAEEAARPLQRRCAELEAALRDIANFNPAGFGVGAICTMRSIAKFHLAGGTPHLDKLRADARRELGELLRQLLANAQSMMRYIDLHDYSEKSKQRYRQDCADYYATVKAAENAIRSLLLSPQEGFAIPRGPKHCSQSD